MKIRKEGDCLLGGKNVAIIGAGVMGRGIAYVFANAGFQTTIVDIDEKVLNDAEREIDRLLIQLVNRGKISLEQMNERKRNLTFTKNLQDACKNVDLVIEAVPEKLEIKKQVFRNLDQFTPSHCILATNTSTMSPTEIGSVTKRPNQVVAMHFFNPVHKMKLVEIAKGLETSEETVRMVKNFAEKIGKEPVVIHEFPGFITSRMSALIGNEAFFMLQEGVATPEEIDKAIKIGLNFPMGPFELADLVGLDTRLNNLKYLHEKLGEKYRPAPLLEQYVAAGWLGRKTGRGVYDYSDKGK
ncbi:3-hydroxyacyl-CoA dehydrogenase [Fervidibacillus halotolerans]|uniref:3-hydroxyacyl-CoA dehydrogenase n=2 Tax=Fervidibacillus halotolerans TaxID=2980027 RepID=A0A9E8M1X7_9BACI|nr:3-hydroxyacyl-CoA dehydrogenase [Fervidibacillus halotolerans]WAA13960.1 3-hydroxyacyl-CoA dehydrogenase [Fervidibacillus halotolerans]